MSEASPESIYAGLVGVFAVFCLGVVALSAPYPAQDALSFVAASRVGLGGQAEVYPSGEVGLAYSPAYAEAYCAGIPACDEVIVPFLSPPPMILLVAPLLLTGFPVAGLRLLAALCLGAGAWLLYAKLRETPSLVRAFPASILMCMPMAIQPIEQGQNSPWLFLTLVVGLFSTSRAGALLAACALAKLSPAALALAWGLDRDVKALTVFGSLVGAGVVAALFLPASAGFEAYADLVPRLGDLAAEHPENISVHPLFGPAWVAVVAVSTVPLLARLSGSDRWALLWLAWLVSSPLVWTHYLWVGFAAVWWLVGRRLSSETLALGLGGWCAAAQLFGIWSGVWLVITWLFTVGVLYRQRT